MLLKLLLADTGTTGSAEIQTKGAYLQWKLMQPLVGTSPQLLAWLSLMTHMSQSK